LNKNFEKKMNFEINPIIENSMDVFDKNVNKNT